MITYSFIIPHKNSPELLNRCVNSIPRRDDVEIIVVDDNSDPDIVDWNTYKFDNDKCITLIQDKTGKGAGHARNVGMEHAHGKWLLFADADDYYIDNFINVIDRYKNLSIDIIYFNFNLEGKNFLNSVVANTFLIQQQEIRKALNIDFIKYKINVPWNKMVSKEYVASKNIYFEEVPQGNDIQFTYLVGYLATSIKIIPNEVYTYCIHTGSTSFSRNYEKSLCMVVGWFKTNQFMLFINHKEWTFHILKSLYYSFHNTPIVLFKIILYLVSHYSYLKKEKYKYVKLASKRSLPSLESI